MAQFDESKVINALHTDKAEAKDYAKPLVTYKVCLNCGNRRDLYWEGGFIWCPICNRPDGSEIK